MARTKIVNGVVMDFTSEEEVIYDNMAKEWNDVRPAREMEEIRRHRNGSVSYTHLTLPTILLV